MRKVLWLSPLLLALASPPAAACEAGICVERTVPADGDTAPTNTRLWVFFDDVAGTQIEAQLFDDEGDEVPVHAELLDQGPVETLRRLLLLLTPEQELAPDATYELRVTLQEDVCGGANTLVTFTTTDAADEEPPPAAGIASVEARFVQDLSVGSNCSIGPPRQRYDVAGDEVGQAIALMLYEGDTLVALAPTGPRAENGGIPRGTDVVTWDVPTEDTAIVDRCFTLGPTDAAGNEAPDAEEHCMGIDPGDDDDDDDDDSAGEGGGCSCAAAAPTGGAAWLLAFAPLLRRRRSGR